LTARQRIALYRVVHSMLNIQGSISVTHDDLLSQNEMEDLKRRLDLGIVEDEE
jgi:hypothetical protein